MKYIFFTGGVVSSLGKGLAAASLGTLLENRGLKVILQKFDPYLNVDPGTMSPYQHGEVYVLDDGAETDLDLGHYERFTSATLSRLNNLTSGQVYESVISKERKGGYLGKTVQVIPHVTNEIKDRIHQVAETMGGDVIITEIGGTVGDIEGLPFLEALRQFALDEGKENVLFVHVTLVPFIAAAKELKTKPTQQSVAKLREIGISPDVIIARCEKELGDDVRNKIALYCNIEPAAVIEGRDVKDTIYEFPLWLRDENFDEIVCKRLGIQNPRRPMEEWEGFVERIKSATREVKIGVIGKYMELQDAYKSIYEAMTHAGAENGCHISIVNFSAGELEKKGMAGELDEVDGILIPGGFGERGIEGKIMAARFARENGLPFLGLCLGMQIATIEYARHVCGMTDANSTEFDPATPYPVICLMEEQAAVREKGGTMRLGKQETVIVDGTLAHELYKVDNTHERHRHRYEVNPKYRQQLEDAGLVVSGFHPKHRLAEIIELSGHPFYLATQFHPEFHSKPNHPHPVFFGFIRSALKRRQSTKKKQRLSRTETQSGGASPA